MEVQHAFWRCFWWCLGRLIRTAQRALLIILGSRTLSVDVFQTILMETEAILNSRPLTKVAELPDNEMLLTPNHFLISDPFSSLPPGKFDNSSPAIFRIWGIFATIAEPPCQHYSKCGKKGVRATSRLSESATFSGY